MRALLRRLHYLLNRRRFDQELSDEMAFHHEMAERSGGVPLGDALRHREDAREAWGAMWLDRLSQDVRYAGRVLRGAPGFTAAAVLVLSMGIGGTIAAFSAYNMAVLRPLPVTDPDSLLRFERRSTERSSTEIPYHAVAFYQEHTRALTTVLAMTSARLVMDGVEVSPDTAFVTANYFADLGGRAVHGRLFDAADTQRDAAPVVVLGFGFWNSQFGGNPAVVGSTIRLNGHVATIIGVTAREFSGLGGNTPAVWAPMEQHPRFVRGSRLFSDVSGQSSGVVMWGRLRDGVSAQMAEDELTALAGQLRRTQPAAAWEDERLVSTPAGHGQMGSEPMLVAFVALVVLILAGACGNLGSLLLARGAARGRELRLRAAIGAGPGRLIRQLFTESLVLAAMGCAGGLALGWFGLKAIMAWTAAPHWLDPSPDWRVALFAVGITVLSAVLFGLAPAVLIARQNHRRLSTVRTLLIGAQVASSCILLVVAGLLGRALERAAGTDPGFGYEDVLVVTPSLREHGYADPAARTYINDLLSRVGSLPGVAQVSVTSTPPLGSLKIMAQLQIDGRAHDVYIHHVDERYLDAMQIPLRRGRQLNATDDRGIVVSESLAQRYWPARDPLGEVFKIGADPYIVIGIAGNARSLALGDPDAVELYRLAREGDAADLSVIVRTSEPAELLTPAVLTTARALDPSLRPQVRLLKDEFQRHTRDIRQTTIAVSVLGAIALAVACLGVVGLMAYSVAQHTKEIGIRLALGARSRHILGQLAGQFAFTLAGGLVAGLLGAAAVAQLLRRDLYGVSTVDPLAYAGAALVFIGAAAAAAWWPARRALRVDPLSALRRE